MGVDFYNCAVCGEINNDCGYMWSCTGCEGVIFECCYTAQVKKYGLAKTKEDIRHFGKDALKSCGGCTVCPTFGKGGIVPQQCAA
jgi:hypothetical protein